MLLQETLPWLDPIAAARGISASERSWVLLHSSLRTAYTGRYSMLAMKPLREVTSNDFLALEAALNEGNPIENTYFGYLGYGLKHALEKLPADAPGNFPLPALWMVQYALILIFDHDTHKVQVWSESRALLAEIPHPLFRKEASSLAIQNLNSNISKHEYLTKVKEIISFIENGNISQANLTRKFFGEFSTAPEPLALFDKLCRLSPAPYSSLLKCGDVFILSSSPEQFLSIDDKGKAVSRPIKGSAPRYTDTPEKDKASREQLASSEKDKAENLMIVDLMRNDFSRGCITGSVAVEKLFEVTSYATVHHMSSTITGKKRTDVSALDFVKNCFPPGSMTGTPKIQAMKLCTALEKVERGVYSGAIGWVSGNGTADFSVVIRTLIMDAQHFEFQVGGAIVADSTPEEEWLETMVKARALAAALGIAMETLEAI